MTYEAIAAIASLIVAGTWPFLLAALLGTGVIFGFFPIAATTLIEKIYPKNSSRRGELHSHIVESLEKNRWTAPIVVFELLAVALREAPEERAKMRKTRVKTLPTIDAGYSLRPVLGEPRSFEGSVSVRLIHDELYVVPDSGSDHPVFTVRAKGGAEGGDVRRFVLEIEDPYRMKAFVLEGRLDDAPFRVVWHMRDGAGSVRILETNGSTRFLHHVSRGRVPKWMIPPAGPDGLPF